MNFGNDGVSLYNVVKKKCRCINNFLEYELIKAEELLSFDERDKRRDVLCRAKSMLPFDLDGALDLVGYKPKGIRNKILSTSKK